jgi:hypothetical protein
MEFITQYVSTAMPFTRIQKGAIHSARSRARLMALSRRRIKFSFFSRMVALDEVWSGTLNYRYYFMPEKVQVCLKAGSQHVDYSSDLSSKD